MLGSVCQIGLWMAMDYNYNHRLAIEIHCDSRLGLQLSYLSYLNKAKQETRVAVVTWNSPMCGFCTSLNPIKYKGIVKVMKL